MKIAFVHFPGRLSRLEAARAGTAPTEFLFGAIELELAGHEVMHYEVDPHGRSSRLGRRLVDANAGRGLLAPHLGAATLAKTRRLLRLENRWSCKAYVATIPRFSTALATGWARPGTRAARRVRCRCIEAPTVPRDSLGSRR